MRAVLDTNVLLRSISHQSALRPIFSALLMGHFELVVSTGILYEYEEILVERNGPFVATATLTALLALDNLVRQRVSYRFQLVANDPDDDKFVDAYVAGRADYLVTDDRHFRSVMKSRFPTVRVVSAADFVKLLQLENAGS